LFSIRLIALRIKNILWTFFIYAVIELLIKVDSTMFFYYNRTAQHLKGGLNMPITKKSVLDALNKGTVNYQPNGSMTMPDEARELLLKNIDCIEDDEANVDLSEIFPKGKKIATHHSKQPKRATQNQR